MTPFASTADSQAALANVHGSLSKLRDVLRECVSTQAPLAVPEDGAAPTTPCAPSKPSPSVKSHSQQLLVQAVVTKVSHDAIIRTVDQARRNSQSDIAMLQQLRQRHASLRYERKLLERQIGSERATQAPALQRLSTALPPVPTGNDPEEAALRAHADTLTRLNDELKRRRDVRSDVDKVATQTKRRRDTLSKTKDEFRALPAAVAKLRNAVDPVQKLLRVGEELAASPPELAQIRMLPTPLYVLAREAFAFRAMFPASLDVALVMEQGSLEALYHVHPRRVRIDVHAGEQGGEKATVQVLFGFHPELHVVTVMSRVVQGENSSVEFEGKGLQLLFPYDIGETSPNPCNAHLEGGAFTFDVSKAGGARPYVWANLLCGLPCLERFDTVNKVVGAGWPTKAAGHEEHVRFKETVSALHSRLRMEMALRTQTEVLSKKRLPVKATELGFAESHACVDEFVQLAAGDWDTVEGLGRDSVNVVFKEVWCMVVRKGEFKVICLVGVAPNYPTGSPSFRLRLESKKNTEVREQAVVELEQRVNMYAMEGELENRTELLLTGQILTLLEGVDTLVPDGEEPATVASRKRGGGKGGKGKLPASLARLLT